MFEYGCGCLHMSAEPVKVVRESSGAELQVVVSHQKWV